MNTTPRLLPLLVAGLALTAPGMSYRGCAAVVLQIGQDFTGATLGVDSTAEPADANGAIGPAHFVELINGRYSVFDKTTGLRVQTRTDLQFWRSSGVTLPKNLQVTDPRVIFDTDSQRWFASMIDFDPATQATNRFLLAVSAGADPTGPWNGFAFLADPSGGDLADFPTLGLDHDGVYLSGDLFDAAGNAVGPTLVSIPKASLLAASPSLAGMKSFGALDYATNGYVLQPAVNFGPSTNGGNVLAMGDLGLDFKPHSTLVGFNILDAAGGSSASLTAPAVINIPLFTVPINPPQPSGVNTLDDGDARISALVYRVGDILYACHGIQVSGRSAVQWFMIDANTHAARQVGRITDPNLHLFYPSIAANTNGVVVISCNGCSSNTFVSSYAVVGENVNGTLTFGALTLLKAGTASYENLDPNGVSRWGDYSATSVDPTDPTRFWTIQMLATGATTWSTRITELITAPLTITIGQSGANLVITWPASAVGFQLQTASALSDANTWTPVTQAPTTVGGQFTVTLPASETQAFFRIAKP